VLKISDITNLPYTNDLTEGAIAYVLHSIGSMFPIKGAPLYDQLRRKIAHAIVELGFRRFLSSQDIPFDIRGAMPFTDPGRFDVMFGGRRCILRSYLITRRNQIKLMKQDPGVILSAPALVPSDMNGMERYREKDIYLFAFITGLVTSSRTDLYRAIQKNLPHYLVHVMPETWSRPRTWHPLGKIILKSESAETQVINIGGQVEGREVRTYQVRLTQNSKVMLDENLFSILYIHSKTLPDARVGVYTSSRGDAHIIHPVDWGNIWVYGIEIMLAGWSTHEEFTRRARMLREGAKVFQYDRTRTKNLYIDMRELNPISTLLDRVMDWST